MAKKSGMGLSVQVDGLGKSKDGVLMTPAKMRRVIRGELAKVCRRSVRRVKENMAVNYRTGALSKAIGFRVVTYGETIVGIVGPRVGEKYRKRHPNLGNIDPKRYAHIVENGRVGRRAAPGKPIPMRFPTLAALKRFLDRGGRRLPGPATAGTSKAGQSAAMRQLARQYGPAVASRIRQPDGPGRAWVFFTNSIRASEEFRPVTRDKPLFEMDVRASVRGVIG